MAQRSHWTWAVALAGLLAGGCISVEGGATPAPDTNAPDASVDVSGQDGAVTPDTVVPTDTVVPSDTTGVPDTVLPDVVTPDVPPPPDIIAPDDVSTPDTSGCPGQVTCAVPADLVCVEAYVDPETCACAQRPAADGAACGSCGGACQSGLCVLANGATSCASATDCGPVGACSAATCDVATCQCVVTTDPECCPAGSCDDENACTVDHCLADGGCYSEPLAGGCAANADCGEPPDACGVMTCMGCKCVASTLTPCTPCLTHSDCDVCEQCAPSGTCEPATIGGTCILAPNACDDGDPCTEDTCRQGQCKGCLNRPYPGCQVCQDDQECDDGDDCTDDLCVGAPDTFCFHPEKASCNKCNGAGVIAISVALGLPAGEPVKVGGTAGPAIDTVSCAPCGGDPTCCDVCVGALGLRDTDGLVLPLSSSDGAWQCRSSTTCEGSPSCDPMIANLKYTAWGKLVGPPPVMPPGPTPTEPTLAVEGWCLQTGAANLQGTYDGTLWAATNTTAKVSFKLLLYIDVGTLEGTVTETSVDGNPFVKLPPGALKNVVPQDGRLEFDLTISVWVLTWVDSIAHFTLRPDGNQLRGSWLLSATVGPTEYQLPGYATLVRQGAP